MTVKRRVDYAELLASAKTKCPACEGKGNMEERAYPPGQAVTTCPNCEGTGLVYLLPDSVRVKCDWVIADGTRLVPHHGMWCCGGPGFTALDPVTGGDTWAGVLGATGMLISIHNTSSMVMLRWEVEAEFGGHSEAACSDSLHTALLEAAWRALLAAGVVKEETS